MKKFMAFLLKLAAVGAAVGAAFAYLKKKGYISVTIGHEDEDLDDFSTPDAEYTERTYINVDTEAMKAKAKEMAEEVKTKASQWAGKAQDKAEEMAEDLKDKAEDAYDEAKKLAGNAATNMASALEKVWYEAEEVAEEVEDEVEEFFNDEEEEK